MKRIAALILAAVVACLCLVSCGGTDVVGKWELEEMTSGGMTLRGDLMGVPVAIMFQFEFKDDGTCYMMQNNGSSSDTQKKELKWEKDGDKVKVTASDESGEMVFEPDGDLLVCTMKENGKDATIKIKKVSSFTEFDMSDIVGN